MGFSRQEYWSGLPFPSPIDTFVKNPRTTMNEPKCKLWVFVDVNTIGSSLVTNVPLMQDVNSRRNWRRGSVWELSVVRFNCSVNLKLL